MTNMNIKPTLLLGAAVLALTLTAPQAGAAEHSPVYISVFGGASLLNPVTAKNSSSSTATVNTSAGYILGGVVGMHFSDGLRGELELSHANWTANHYSKSYNSGDGAGFTSGAATGNISATYLLTNLWYDLPTHSSFTPYFGGGVGVAFANANVPEVGWGDGRGASFAFQVGTGLTFDVSEHAKIDIGYRFKAIPNATFQALGGGSDWTGANLYSHNVQIGLTYEF